MPLLPAVVPDLPENRSEIVPARLARKVGPLFGVPWADGPLGQHTWVSDYTRITLTEIARGAPLPTRAQAVELTPRMVESWQILDRIGVAGRSEPLPDEIPNATLNRFGPDTKAAVVLTAVNRLLAPVTEAVEVALPLLVDADGAPLPAQLRLAAWAGLIVETFRSQPALVAAGIRARTIQRELVQSWRLPVSNDLAGLLLTRCEIDPDAPDQSATGAGRPHMLDLADRTFDTLRVAGGLHGAESVDTEHGDDVDRSASELTARLLHDEAVDHLLRRLLAAGTLQDASHLWLSERAPGQLAVEALMPPTNLIALFVRQAARSLGTAEQAAVDPPPLVLPAVPTEEQLTAMPPLGRRATLITLLTVLRHIQHSPTGRDGIRHDIVPVLNGIARRARDCLDPDDPVSVLVRCRVADMVVQTLRHDQRVDLREPLADLLAQLDRCEDLLRRGELDRGAAAEAISSACVEINAVRRTNAALPGSGLPTPDHLYERLRRGWRTFHDALEIRPWAPGADRPHPPGLVGHHLHNYAAFLAGSPAGEADLREAVDLFRDIVLPAREQFFERSESFLPLRHSLQVASRATTRLGECARNRGELEAAAGWAALGYSWITRALADDETQRMLGAQRPTEGACRLALLAAPTLLLAVEIEAPGACSGDVETVERLVRLVRRWEHRSVGEDGTDHTRHDEVVTLQRRLDALSADRNAETAPASRPALR